MSEYGSEEGALTIEELREERIQLLAANEFHLVVGALIFTSLVLIFAQQSPEALRLCLTALAGGFFLAAGYNRLLRNIAGARRP